MKHADTNNDGKISMQDFLNASMTSNTMANLLRSTIKAADSPYLRRKVRNVYELGPLTTSTKENEPLDFSINVETVSQLSQNCHVKMTQN